MSDGALAWGERRGVEMAAHRSRMISPDMVSSADLILAMEPTHVREVVALYDPAWEYTFTLRELVLRATAAGVGARREGEHLDEWLARASRGRRRVDLLADRDDLSIADPYRAADDVYDATARAIASALSALIAALWPAQIPQTVQTSPSQMAG